MSQKFRLRRTEGKNVNILKFFAQGPFFQYLTKKLVPFWSPFSQKKSGPFLVPFFTKKWSFFVP